MSAERRFYIKRGDRAPYLQVQVLNPDDTARDLSTASAIQLNMGKEGALVPKINMQPMTSIFLGQGIVEYRWAAADTDTVGEFRAEIVVTEGGKSESFPHDGYIIVEVVQDVA